MSVRTLRPRAALVVTAAAALLALPATASATELLYATTPTNQLISFTAQAPGAIISSEPITGLAAGESIVGLDRRQATGQMYALTSTGRVLIVDVSSGDTKLVTPEPLALTGTTFGFDFNPVGDRIRVTSDAEINRRVNPETGGIANDDALRYPAGDSGAGTNASVGAAAYTNGGFGGGAPASTELFVIDSARDALLKQDPPNDGVLTTVGPLGQTAIEPVQFDISGAGSRMAAFATSPDSGVQLWALNAAGAATPTSAYPFIGVPAITSLATAGDVPDDTSAPTVSLGNYTTFRGIWLSRGLRFTVTCLTDCRTVSTLRIGSTIVGTAESSTSVAASRAPLIKLNAIGRKLAAKPGRLAASLTLTSNDLAGNKRTQVVKFSSIAGINTAG